MKELYIETVKYPYYFEQIYGTIIQLDKDYQEGDIIYYNNKPYILSCTLNPSVILDIIRDDKYKKGKYVQIAPLWMIKTMYSESKFNIPDFSCMEETTRFYNIICFDEELNEITDKNNYKDVTRYFYKRIND